MIQNKQFRVLTGMFGEPGPWDLSLRSCAWKLDDTYELVYNSDIPGYEWSLEMPNSIHGGTLWKTCGECLFHWREELA